MASRGGERDELDSLFEGMVLFDPSEIADNDNFHLHQQDKDQQQPISPPPPSDASQPLDENLFSDLTLINSVQSHLTLTTDDSATTTSREVPSSSISRQVSTRKKRRAGLRIGYGRDASILDDQSNSHPARSAEPELPPPSPSLPSSPFTAETESAGSAPPQHEEETADSLSVSHPSLPTATTTVELDYSSRVCEEVGSSLSSAANGSYRDDNMLSDAEPRATVSTDDLQSGEDQINISAPFESRFEQIRCQISKKLGHVRELVGSVSAVRKDSIRRRRKAAEAVNLASARFRELEKELEEACEAEDFETAERVSESLAHAETDKEQLAVALRHAEADCDAIDSKIREALERQIAVEEECASLLKNFSTDAANDANLILKNAEAASEKELDKWLSLTEDLELKKMELDIESDLINAAKGVLNDSIEQSAEDDRREREILCKRKELLTEELEKLLALVKQKEAEIAETDNSIEAVEKRIADVVSTFQEAQSTIDTNFDSLRSNLSQMELENEGLTRKKKEIDDFLSQEKDKGMRLKELVLVSADEAKMYQDVVELRKNLMMFTLGSIEEKVRLTKTEEKLSGDVHMLKQEISSARASLQELSSTKSSFQQESESLKQRVAFIDKRVPELEAEKKVAAAARNFKEAARIATESKTLTVEKEGLQTKIAADVLELRKLEEEISNTVNRLQETEGQILTMERELAMARFQRLLLIAGAAKAERSAALELGDLEEADILLAEAEAAEAEARKIPPVYGFEEEEFANLPKQCISMELVSYLGGKQLAELAASACPST
ncbi:uncharacterized protein LOC127807931 [Diospyros lotus]|uniref:uncharacterized protein LOC127807931 n=1 Tax=Diospyros lotus TaxID=55363 RepID=UPI002252676B|nr:uncharacterized protein LOC127807931 [Diospyros lotus]